MRRRTSLKLKRSAWVYALGMVATLGLAGPASASNARWMQFCTAHGSVWSLVSPDGTPMSDQIRTGCHSNCILPRRLRTAR